MAVGPLGDHCTHRTEAPDCFEGLRGQHDQPRRNDGVWVSRRGRLLLELSNAVDEGHVSWAQLQVKVVVSADLADSIDKAARAGGPTPSSRPV